MNDSSSSGSDARRLNRGQFLRGAAALGGTALAAPLAFASSGEAHASAGAASGDNGSAEAQGSTGGYVEILPTGRQHEIYYGDQRVVVTEVGATLRSYTIAGRELLDTFGPEEYSDASRGQVLLPWPNRVDGGLYEFGGEENQLPLTEPAADNAIHGLTSWSNWLLLDRSPSHVTLGLRLYPQDGWPFVLGIEISYTLSSAGLTVCTGVQNLGTMPLPFGAGHHPYVTVGTPTINTALLRLPASTYLTTNDRLIPTGRASVEGTDFDFRETREIGGTELDTCFTDVIPDADGYTRVVMTNPESGFGITVAMDPSHGFIQAYTGDTLPDESDRRQSIAIEPMTCAPDAFNNGMGLRVLQPGEVLSNVLWTLSAF